MQFYHTVMCPKDADRMANSADPDKTVPSVKLANLSTNANFKQKCSSAHQPWKLPMRFCKVNGI